MRRWLPRGPCIGVAVLVTVLVAPPAAHCQTIQQQATVVSAGGAPGTGGVFRLNATVGQGSGIGRTAAGSFCENVGFWYSILPEVTPGSVDTLLISLATSTSAVLTWTTTPYADAYRVFRESVAYFDATGAPWTVVNAPDTTLTVTTGIGDTSVDYSYRVRAWSSGGEGAPSNTVGEHDFSSTGTLLKNGFDVPSQPGSTGRSVR
ncbi:fibronectin type III domain-containing protein [Candidatus Fermentibacteria bacterium]|nr:fibronectin type III domain-containing protein [Candidatus Fermentibacteria bacterium]